MKRWKTCLPLQTYVIAYPVVLSRDGDDMEEEEDAKDAKHAKDG